MAGEARSIGTIRTQFEKDGRVWLRGAVSPEELSELEKLSDMGSRPGARISKSEPLFHFVQKASFAEQIATIWPGMQSVRLVSFDKNPTANWGVPWHQDRVIAVNERIEAPGFINWTRKSGGWHCEPPVTLLERMLFVRVHIDRNTVENGAMEIALGSHRAGKVTSETAAEVAGKFETELTLAEPGDVLVLAMLTLHRSTPSVSRSNRRALRVDYSSDQLPKPLGWVVEMP